MANWNKIGRIFNPSDYVEIQWLDQFAQAPATLVFDDFVRVYFSCRPKPIDGQFVSDTAWVDFDRKDLTKVLNIAKKPILPRGDKGTFDEFGVYPTSIVRNEDKVVAYYGGWTRCEAVPFNVAIGRATSSDNGESFTKEGPGPIISYSPEEPFVMSGPKIRKFGSTWYLFYIAGKKWISTSRIAEPVYQIRMAYSDDGITWKKENKDLIPPRIEEDECQASPDVFFKDGVYHMFFCYRKSLNFRGKEGGYRIGYAFSTDLINWTRDDSKSGIDVSESGWDSEMVAYPHVFELDGEIYMMYLGNDVGREGFGLAKLSGKL